jgi:hypothetical protein
MPEAKEMDAWYLFVHQLPPKPSYLRAKVRKLLSQAGALPLKDSVYALPLRSGGLKTLQQIADVAVGDGGDAFVFQGQFVEKPRAQQLIGAFQKASDDDYSGLIDRLRSWAHELARRSGKAPPEGRVRFRLAHAQRRFEQIARNDFFDAPARAQAQTALGDLATRLQPGAETTVAKRRHRELVGRTWVTRRGVQVDRIGSAWLIRRFIDPNARFRFIDFHAEQARPGELTFDMTDADFTHEEDRCTFETLVRRIDLNDAALERVAEIIHDIDIKDGKFGRAEATGIQQVLSGILMANPGDESRLARGFPLLDDLYQSFCRTPPPHSSSLDRRSAGPRSTEGGLS